MRDVPSEEIVATVEGVSPSVSTIEYVNDCTLLFVIEAIGPENEYGDEGLHM